MPKFGKASLARLSTCHLDLQRLFNEVIKEIDCSVICGHRGMEAQNEAFSSGNSKLCWPKSKHNNFPSTAIDVVPYPIDWNDEESFKRLADVVKICAADLDIKITWGGNWKFKDMPHYELTEE